MREEPMSTPLVSILIPCYNGGAFLRATIESALAQSHPNCEVILVDDGSTDDSLSTARSFEPRVKVFAGPNRGASAARDQATGNARGEWLQYLDADDLLLPHAVASRLAALESAQADVACSDWRRLVLGPDGSWENGKLENADYRAFSDEVDLAVFKGFWAPPAAILYRKALVDRIGRWPANLPVIQDARFLFDAALLGGRFVHVPNEGAQYRQHSAQSLSSTSSVRFWRDVYTNAQEVEAIWAKKGALTGARSTAVAGAYSLGARVSFPIDEALFNANLEGLRRFPDHPSSKYLRVAVALKRVFGYGLARRIIGVLRPGSQK
jgi:glycosyltransferase involved in cell wall biosynthesis